MTVAPKPRFLASVRSLEEAMLAASLGAELIDLKEPSQGALGAVDSAEQCRIVGALDSLGVGSQPRPPISATVGDLPFEPALLAEAIRRTAATGVDIVKFGVYASGVVAQQGFIELDRLLAQAPPSVTLVALLLADQLPAIDEALALSRAALRVRGLKGVMLDTATKGGSARPLPEVFTVAELGRFVAEVHELGGFAGLAGCLGIQHIEALAATGADILGFRGALCHGTRTGMLDAAAFGRVYDRLRAVRSAPSSCPSPAAGLPRNSSSSAVALAA
jgi:(5-formylfuran-3-yl)methyl phosphate synthase